MAFYLFPGHTYNRIKEEYQKNFLLSYDDDSATIDALRESDPGWGPLMIERFYGISLGQRLQASYQLYQLYSRQYWGFGVLLQFFPGTNAKRAREQLIQDLEPEVNAFEGKRSKRMMPDFENSFLNFLSIKFDHLVFDFIIHLSKIAYPDGRPLGSIFLITMPLVKDVFSVDRKHNLLIQSDALRNILHSILNPFRLIKDCLNFLRKGINLLLEFGARNHTELSIFQVLLK